MKAVYRTMRMALHALRRNVMRSVLTCLGIIIGIAAVIAMMEIGRGSSSSIAQTIASLGANIVQVDPKFNQRCAQPRVALHQPQVPRFIGAALGPYDGLDRRSFFGAPMFGDAAQWRIVQIGRASCR